MNKEEEMEKKAWYNQPAKEDIFDKFVDWLTGDKPGTKTQGEEVIDAQYTEMAFSNENFAAELQSEFETGARGLASMDRINEVMENSEEMPVVNVGKNQGISNKSDILKNSGLSKMKVDEILATPKGSRPDPLTYLNKDYIEQHLKQFENGASYIMPKSDYDFYYRGVPEISRPDGTMFFAPKDYMDSILKDANGDISVIENRLGYPNGSLANGDFSIVNINNPQNYNMHIPSGNEHGANSEWIPGGYTSGGIPEVILEHVPNDVKNIKKVFLERK
ncbi:hypothetical protein [Clostridium felsineum]|nr:hypothetical protein [Clostridium felsineum]URZ01290.1 hypothetical protein CLAUR_012790 [Clostridium felsineum]